MSETSLTFQFIEATHIETIVPLLLLLNGHTISEELLRERVREMAQQNYECIGIYDTGKLIGCCGLWFQTRHYAGKSVEMDHVIIGDAYRNKGVGKRLLAFVNAHARRKNCCWIELNTYVDNFLSHKFYRSNGFDAKGYHFVKDIT